jgi:hypothetical protein
MPAASSAIPPLAPSTNRSWIRRLRAGASRVYWNLHRDRYDVFVRPVRATDARFEAPPGYRFVFAEPAQLSSCEAEHTELHARDREHGLRRLELGHQLVLALDSADTAVFSMWINPRNLNVPGQLKRALAPHQAFIYKAFTSPAHRGKRLYQAGMGFVLADLYRRGLTELVGYAHTSKDSSRAGLARLQFTTIGHYRVLGYGARVGIWLSPGLRQRFPRAVPRSGLDIT